MANRSLAKFIVDAVIATLVSVISYDVYMANTNRMIQTVDDLYQKREQNSIDKNSKNNFI